MPKKRQSEEEYYEENEEQENTNPVLFGLTTKKIATITIIAIVGLIVLALAISLLNQKNNILFKNENGEQLQGKITITANGNTVDSFSVDGNKLTLESNPYEKKGTRIKTTITNNGKKKTTLIIKKADGTAIFTTRNQEDIYLNENGTIHFSFDPIPDLGLEEYFDEETQTFVFPENETLDLIFEFVIQDEETGEIITIEIPADLWIKEFTQTGCIALNRTTVKETTHYGQLELELKARVLCDGYSNLESLIKWTSERMGNAEIVTNDGKNYALLAPYKTELIKTPAQNEYTVKVIFTPFEQYAGKTADFDIEFYLGEDKQKINFDVPIENLEQCIKITPEKIIIPKEQENGTLIIDVSSCASKRIDLTLCENDPQCSGGTEGGITLSRMSLNLSPQNNPSETITITRGEIAGAYGIPIQASVLGTQEAFIDEKLVIVEPGEDTTIMPDKYVISLIGGAKDSVKIRNKQLAEDVPVQASICALYKSSLGITGTGTTEIINNISSGNWWQDMAANPKKYSGEGLYQASLTNTLETLSNMQTATQAESRAKNTIIKQAYLSSTNSSLLLADASNESSKAIQAANKLKQAIGEANQNDEIDLAGAMVSLGASIATLAADIATFAVTTEVIADQVSAMQISGPMKCPVTAPGLDSAGLALRTASTHSKYYLAEMSQLAITFSQLKMLYNQIHDFANEADKLDTKAALENEEEAKQQLGKALETTKKAEAYMELALASASINDCTTASQEDSDSAKYMALAKTEFENAKKELEEALKQQLAANDAITVAIQKEPNNTEQIVELLSVCTSILASVGILQGTQANIRAELVTAYTGLSAAQTAALLHTGVPGCGGSAAEIAVAQEGVATIQVTSLTQIAEMASILSKFSTIYQAYQFYQGLTTDYTAELKKTNDTFNSTTAKIYSSQEEIENGIILLPQAIIAAQWLAEQEKMSSQASTFENETIVTLDGNYNKKRMIGLIGAGIMTGFVDGAYEGGVYTTKNTFVEQTASPLREAETQKQPGNGKALLEGTGDTYISKAELKEDCENMVELTLPDYVTNLMNDAKEVSVSNQEVIAVWDFSNTKVFDVFEEQETGITFANAGLKKNSYGIVELTIEKHLHEKPTQTTTEISPFDIPDSGKEQQTIKYHFKFNAAPRKGNNYAPKTNDECSLGLMRGEKGKEAAPKIILSWDWNSVQTANTKQGQAPYRTITNAILGGNDDPYLDATQLTILLSKKLGSLTNFLEKASPMCPDNPAKIILSKVRPEIMNLETGMPYTGESTEEKCFLPPTTRKYDGKPALYYFIKNEEAIPGEKYSDAEAITNREELLKIINFETNLIRDGYGTDFQYDFVNSYTSSILKAGQSFTDSATGTKKYFSTPERAYYSSEANQLKTSKNWAIPDTGKYLVNLIIDFESQPALFMGSAPNAKIIFDLYSIEPINSNYSPFYYTPFDGFTGLNTSNNRRYYGSALSNSAEPMPIGKNEGAFLQPEQKDSLIKLKLERIDSFFMLNSLPSKKGKLLEYYYNYNPATRKDENSKMSYSPSTATPLLFELRAQPEKQTQFLYSIMKNGSKINSSTANAFILDAVGECSDLAGKELKNFFTKAPDAKYGQEYGVILSDTTQEGKTYLTTTAYAPIEDTYEITKPKTGQIYTTNDTQGINKTAILDGITGMQYNNKQGNSTTDSLLEMLQAVESGNLCKTSYGPKETIYWSEKILQKKEGAQGTTIQTKTKQAEQSCAK